MWTAPEHPLPVERADVEQVVGPPGWLVCATRADGIVRVMNHGTDHALGPQATVDSPFYARHGYSSHAAPDLSQDRLQRPADSHVALLDAAGVPSRRTPLQRVEFDVYGLGLASRSRAHWLDLSGDGGNAGEAQSIRRTAKRRRWMWHGSAVVGWPFMIDVDPASAPVGWDAAVAGAAVGAGVAVAWVAIVALGRTWVARDRSFGGVALAAMVIWGSMVPYLAGGWLGAGLLGLRHPWLIALLATLAVFARQMLHAVDVAIGWTFVLSVAAHALAAWVVAPGVSVVLRVLLAAALLGMAVRFLVADRWSVQR